MQTFKIILYRIYIAISTILSLIFIALPLYVIYFINENKSLIPQEANGVMTQDNIGIFTNSIPDVIHLLYGIIICGLIILSIIILSIFYKNKRYLKIVNIILPIISVISIVSYISYLLSVSSEYSLIHMMFQYLFFLFIVLTGPHNMMF